MKRFLTFALALLATAPAFADFILNEQPPANELYPINQTFTLWQLYKTNGIPSHVVVPIGMCDDRTQYVKGISVTASLHLHIDSMTAFFADGSSESLGDLDLFQRQSALLGIPGKRRCLSRLEVVGYSKADGKAADFHVSTWIRIREQEPVVVVPAPIPAPVPPVYHPPVPTYNREARLGRVTFDGAYSRDKWVQVDSCDRGETVSAIKIYVSGDSVRIHDFMVRFRDGTTQHIQFRPEFTAHSESAWKDLAGDQRCITDILIDGEGGDEFYPASVGVYGRVRSMH